MTSAAVDRRALLLAATSAAAGLVVPSRTEAAGPVAVRLSVDYTHPGRPIPENFIGLSYEASLVADGNYFTPENRTLLNLLRGLGRRGVLRIGGNSSDRTGWQPQHGSAVGNWFMLTPGAIDRLAQFLAALDWQVIYGLNLGSGTPEMAADEAAYVAEAVGERLLAFQIGNEPDGFGRWNDTRSKTYDATRFIAEWQDFHAAIRTRVPKARFAGPDVSYRADWIAPFAAQRLEGLVLLTRHYYPLGPASDPAVTLDKLLASRAQMDAILGELARLGGTYRLPYRIAEVNSVFQGGRRGVSDTLGAALWGTELMFQIAAAGGAGVNFHTAPLNPYTPIASRNGTELEARPLYYGMLLFAQLGAGTLVPVHAGADSDSIPACAVRAGDGTLRIGLINKDPASAVEVRVDAGRPVARASVLRLAGAALDAAADITFGASQADEFGRWLPAAHAQASVLAAEILVELPAASAALLHAE